MVNKKRKYTIIRDELDEVLVELQNVDTDVDKAIDLHKKGIHLIKELSDYLDNAKNEINKTSN